MREDVEHGGKPCTDTETEHHVAKLRHRRIRQNFLNVVLNECKRCSDDDRDTTDDGDEVHRGVEDVKADEEHRVETSDQEHTSNDHGRRVQQ